MVALLGAVVLFGWAAGIDASTRVLPGLATMKPNTALGFLLAGAALALSTPGWHAGWRLGWRRCGAARDADDGRVPRGHRPGHRQRAAAALADAAHEPAGRMSLATAVAFAAIGGALLGIDSRRFARMAQAAALAAGVIGLLALIGTLLDVRALYGVVAFSSVAVHTAAAHAALSLGVLLARPAVGVMGVITGRAPAAWPRGSRCPMRCWRRWSSPGCASAPSRLADRGAGGHGRGGDRLHRAVHRARRARRGGAARARR
ncbi:MAG: hypothetical protein U1F25_18480 [Rubrivivax sp.]